MQTGGAIARALLLMLARVPYSAHVLRTHSLICTCVTPTRVCACVCVCVCRGRAIMACLTQSTSITCCNLEQHLQDNVKGTASTSPPCTPSMCIRLHTATPLHSFACIAHHSLHCFKSSCISVIMQPCFYCVPSETICSCRRHA